MLEREWKGFGNNRGSRICGTKKRSKEEVEWDKEEEIKGGGNEEREKGEKKGRV